MIMPKGPKGEKRPADVIGNAVHVMRIATGQIEEVAHKTRRAVGGKRGGKARAAKLPAAKRREIAQKAAAARWKGRAATK